MVLRPKPEKVEERERIRLSLLRATVTLAAKHGFAGLGLREVAREANIAPTSFYRHFTDMEELALALIAELVGPLLARWNEQAEKPASDPQRPLAGLIDEALRAVREEPDLMRFVLAERVGAVGTCRAALQRKLSELAAVLAAHALGRAEPRTSLRSRAEEPRASTLRSRAEEPRASTQGASDQAARGRTETARADREVYSEAIVLLLFESCVAALELHAHDAPGLEQLRLRLESQLGPLLRAGEEKTP